MGVFVLCVVVDVGMDWLSLHETDYARRRMLSPTMMMMITLMQMVNTTASHSLTSVLL